MTKNSERYTNILKKRYLLAFTLIALLVILSEFIIQLAIHKQENDSTVINIAGRQRMLSQRISKAAFGLYIENNLTSQNIYLNELKSSTDLWKESHIELQNGSKTLGLPNKNSNTIKKLFSDIKENHENILKASYDIISMVQKGTYKKEDLYPKIQLIKENESIFLNGMDSIVFQYNYESNQKVKFIKYMELSILFITLLLLLLELIFIFKPVENEINHAFEKLSKTHNNLLNLLETAPVPMFIINEECLNIIYINKRAEEILNIKNEDSINFKLSNILKHNSKNNKVIINKIKNLEKISNEEIIFYNINNKKIIALISSRKIIFHDKPTILISLSDITKLKKAEKILKRHATIDEMTGLLNKRAGLISLEHLLKKSKNNKNNIGITFIDIDELKTVNDTYGHEEGDWYIKTISKIITSNISSKDCVFRYGGDEIILAINNSTPCKSDSILKAIENNLSIIEKENNKPYKLSISYGTVFTNFNDKINIDELVKQADHYMYKNKKTKKGQ